MKAFILVDMIGDADLDILEGNRLDAVVEGTGLPGGQLTWATSRTSTNTRPALRMTICPS